LPLLGNHTKPNLVSNLAFLLLKSAILNF
jgi:hypothetical protein